MLDKMLKLISDNYLYFTLTYSNGTDYTLSIKTKQQARTGETPIYNNQHADLDVLVAEAYLKLTDYLSNENGGY